MHDDPYREWLDIRDPVRPPDHYALLGLPRYENHAPLIKTAAVERACRIWGLRRRGRRLARELLIEVAGAHWVLSRRQEKSLYDHGLRGVREAGAESEAPPEERFRRAALLERLFTAPSERRKGALAEKGRSLGLAAARIHAILEELDGITARFDPRQAEDELRELADLPDRRRAIRWAVPAVVAAASLVVVGILLERFITAVPPRGDRPAESAKAPAAPPPAGLAAPEGPKTAAKSGPEEAGEGPPTPAKREGSEATQGTEPGEGPRDAAGPETVDIRERLEPVFRRARELAQRGAFQAARAALEEASSSLGPAAGAVVDAERERIEAIRAEQAEAALAELGSEVDRLAAEGRHEEIPEALDRFPRELRTEAAAERLDALRRACATRLEERYAEIEREARALAAEGRYQRAIARLDRVRRWGIPEITARAEAVIGSVLDERRARRGAPPIAPKTPEEAFREAFGEALEAARSTPARKDEVALAREMVERAAAADTDPALAKLLLEQAGKLTDATPDGLRVAIRIEEVRARRPGQDPERILEAIVALQEKLAKSPLLPRGRRPEEIQTLFDRLEELARRRIAAGRFAEAIEADQRAARAARVGRKRDERWRRFVEARAEALGPWARLERRLAIARKTVERRPTDARANRTLGRHAALLAGDDVAARAYLEAGRDRRMLELLDLRKRLGAAGGGLQQLLAYAERCMQVKALIPEELHKLALLGEAETAWRRAIGHVAPIDPERREIDRRLARAAREADELAAIDPDLPEPWLALWTATDTAPHLADLVLGEQWWGGALWRRTRGDLYWTRHFAGRRIVFTAHPPRRDLPMRFLCRRPLTARTSVLYIGLRARGEAEGLEVRVAVDDGEVERRAVGGAWLDLRVALSSRVGGTHTVAVEAHPVGWGDETVLWDYVSFAPPGP